MRKPILWLLGFTFLHGLWYTAIIHPWQAPDENLHYEYMRILEAERTLSPTYEDRSSEVQWSVAESMWDFQHFRYRLLPTPNEAEFRSDPKPLGDRNFTPQPPLYYLLSIPIYWATRSWSVLGQLYVLRMFSVLLLCATVWLTYRIGRLLFSTEGSDWPALIPAAMIALLPQYTFISASYNNDNLAPPLIALSLLLLVEGYQDPPRLRSLAAASAVGVLALAAKRTAVGILPVLGSALFLYGWRWQRSDEPRFRWLGRAALAVPILLLVLVVVLLVEPPPLPRGLARLLRLSPHALVALSNRLAGPTQLAAVDWPRLGNYTLTSFWGQFGWLTLPAPAGWLKALRWATLALLVGINVGLVRYWRGGRHGPEARIPFAVCLGIVGIASTLAAMLAQYLIAPQVYPPQGRYLFPFISAFGFLAAWAWRAYWPDRAQKPAGLLAVAFLAAFDVAAWGFVILPAWYV